jgi:hypothetical protein
MALNSLFSCLSFWSDGITGMLYHDWLIYEFFLNISKETRELLSGSTTCEPTKKQLMRKKSF